MIHDFLVSLLGEATSMMCPTATLALTNEFVVWGPKWHPSLMTLCCIWKVADARGAAVGLPAFAGES